MSATIVLILRLLLVISLYAFIAWALITIWRDQRQQALLLASRRVPTLRLRVEEGETEKAQSFDKAEVLVGRDATCDFVLENETVSLHHARLVYHHNQWWVEDLQSTNGTFLNDERVYMQTVLISNDELRCGKVYINVTFG
ncbi:MAG TPA: FHA domain-containing protein [Chloroflexi bacterium]|nr:FHA domain-containing protein [Chloroflexota bacterium]HPO58534.1 FHA domain-containing protein [Anaerolineaceae bacterium]